MTIKTPRVVSGIALLCLVHVARLPAQDQDQLTEKTVLEKAEENIGKYRKSGAVVTLLDEFGKPMKGVELEIRQTTQDFLFGALVFDLAGENRLDPDKTELFKERFSEIFNLAIFPFYWGAYEPQAGHPRWDRIEPVLEWCLDQGIACKGHPLGWTHEIGLPDYVLDMSLEESEKLLESRIIENVTGFKDRITLWDVVNEPVNTVSWEMAHSDKSKEHRYTTDIPIDTLAGWVDNAYRTAYLANPDNEYILNEFRQFANPAMRQRFFDFTTELLERGTPISGLGIQAHEPRADWFDPVEVWRTLEWYKDFDLPIHITEFIPQSAGAEITGGYRSGQWTPETQAAYAETMYRIWFGHPAVVSINWWAFSDANAWLPGGGFVDADFKPKPVYHVLQKLIREEWRTPGITSKTNGRGKFKFRGFHGYYEIVATNNQGISKEFTMHLEKGDANSWELKMD